MFIQTETTPNPATLKFLPGRPVMGEGTADFPNAEAGARSPLAARLFAVPEVERVFFGSDFVTVTKREGDWRHLKPAILGAIMEHYLSGDPVAFEGAVLDVWEAQGDGFYDVQKPGEPNARARFRTGPDGKYWFRCVKPSSYPVPHDGPVGRVLKASGRHPMRPGHLHFKIAAPGFDTLVTHIFVKGDPYLSSDAVFGVKQSLIVDFRKAKAGGYECRYDFVLKPEGVRKLPGKKMQPRTKKAK